MHAARLSCQDPTALLIGCMCFAGKTPDVPVLCILSWSLMFYLVWMPSSFAAKQIHLWVQIK